MLLKSCCYSLCWPAPLCPPPPSTHAHCDGKQCCRPVLWGHFFPTHLVHPRWGQFIYAKGLATPHANSWQPKEEEPPFVTVDRTCVSNLTVCRCGGQFSDKSPESRDPRSVPYLPTTPVPSAASPSPDAKEPKLLRVRT